MINQKRKLLEIIEKTGYSKRALAAEAAVNYSTLNHWVSGRVERPKWEEANALLLVLNRALSAQGQPQISLKEIEEFSQLRGQPTPLPEAGVEVGEVKVEVQERETQPRAVEKVEAISQGRRKRLRRDRVKGRPLGSYKRPGAIEPLSATERFLSEVFGPQGYYGTQTRATELLEALVREFASLSETLTPGRGTVPVEAAQNVGSGVAVVNLALPNRKALPLPVGAKVGFTLIAYQEAQKHQTAGAETNRARSGTLTFQIEVVQEAATELEKKPATPEEEETATERNLSGERVRVWLKQYQEVVPPIVPGGDIVLSWAEFERLTLLQLKLVVDYYLAQTTKR